MFEFMLLSAILCYKVYSFLCSMHTRGCCFGSPVAGDACCTAQCCTCVCIIASGCALPEVSIFKQTVLNTVGIVFITGEAEYVLWFISGCSALKPDGSLRTSPDSLGYLHWQHRRVHAPFGCCAGTLTCNFTWINVISCGISVAVFHRPVSKLHYASITF